MIYFKILKLNIRNDHMNIYKVPAAVLLALTLSACGGADTAQDGGDELIPGIGVNGNLQAVPSKSEE